MSTEIVSVTPEAATAPATRLLSPDHVVLVVVGDRSKIEAGIRELNLGPLRLLDGDGRPMGEGTK